MRVSDVSSLNLFFPVNFSIANYLLFCSYTHIATSLLHLISTIINTHFTYNANHQSLQNALRTLYILLYRLDVPIIPRVQWAGDLGALSFNLHAPYEFQSDFWDSYDSRSIRMSGLTTSFCWACMLPKRWIGCRKCTLKTYLPNLVLSSHQPCPGRSIIRPYLLLHASNLSQCLPLPSR